MSQLPLQIRLADIADVQALSSLAMLVFAQTYGRAIPPTTLRDYLQRKFSTEAIRADLMAGNARLWLAWHDGQLIGYGKLAATPVPTCVHDKGALELVHLYVDAAHHGNGVAATLLRQSIADAAQRGWRTLWLCTWIENPRAIAFYQKHGFQTVGRHPVYVDDVFFDDLVLTKTLTL